MVISTAKFKFDKGDKVADIGILDMEATIVTPGEQCSVVRFPFGTQGISNENLVLWGSEEHRNLLKQYPGRRWNKEKPIENVIAEPDPSRELREAPVNLRDLFQG